MSETSKHIVELFCARKRAGRQLTLGEVRRTFPETATDDLLALFAAGQLAVKTPGAASPVCPTDRVVIESLPDGHYLVFGEEGQGR